MTAPAAADDLFAKHLADKLIREIYLHSGIHSNSRVLETSSGQGDYIARLHNFNPCFCYGLEDDPARLETARQQVRGVQFLEGRLEDIQFPDHFWNLVFSINQLHRLEAPGKYFRRTRNILQQKGISMHLADVETLFDCNKQLLLGQIQSAEGLQVPILDKLTRQMQRSGLKHVHTRFLPVEFQQPEERLYIYWILSGVKE